MIGRRDEPHEAGASVPASSPSRPAWDPAGIGLLSFFLSILPAGILQAINYGRLGAPERIRWALVRNLGAACVFFSAAAFTDLPNLVFAVFNSLSYFYFRESQRDLFVAHRARGGAKASFRRPIVYSCLGILGVLLLGVGYASVLDLRDQRRFNEAVAHMEAERYEAAEVLFKKYQSSNPDDIGSYWNLALIYLWQADTQLAVQQLRASVAKDPSDSSARALLAELAPTSSANGAGRPVTTSDIVWTAAQGELAKRLADLELRPYAELRQLPKHHTEVVGEVSYTTYREVLEGDRLQIVVQASMPRGTFLFFFDVSSVAARGFRISPDGLTEAMGDRDLSSFR